MEQTLDSSFIEEKFDDPGFNLASAWRRFFNFIIDMLMFYLFAFFYWAILAVFNFSEIVIRSKLINLLLVIGIRVGYYILFEQVFGKTIGKMITQTRVVDEKGQKPSFNKIIGRTLSRLIPFDQISFLSSEPIGWHDTISGTRVVNDRPKITAESIKTDLIN